MAKPSASAPPTVRDTRPQQQPQGDVTPPARSPELPHERDQSANINTTDTAAGQENIIEKGRRDVEAGRQDTDCRNVPGAPDCPTQEKLPRT